MVHYINPNIILKSIQGMSNEVNFNDFRLKTGIENVAIFKQLLNFLDKNRIGICLDKNGKQMLIFSKMDRIKASLLALQLGCDIQECSKLLSWKDFEYFTSELLSLFEYQTRKSILSCPNLELN